MTRVAARAVVVAVASMIATPVAPSFAADEPSGARGFVRDVARDYVEFLSPETAIWLGVGGAAALGVHAGDEALRDATQSPDGPLVNLVGGHEYGGAFVQAPLAVGWWIGGRAAGNERAIRTGQELLRAQISAVSWTYAFKFAADRTRPNGDPRSFPSGHASATFATAIVLEEEYGWKLGVPAFAAAAYTAVSRVTDNKHWASDVVFGAFLGLASGRTATIRLRGTDVLIRPVAMAGGGAIVVRLSR